MRRLNKEGRLRDSAKDCFIRAAAALTELPTTENVGFAVFHGCLGLMRLAESDADNRVLGYVQHHLRLAKEASKASARQRPQTQPSDSKG